MSLIKDFLSLETGGRDKPCITSNQESGSFCRDTKWDAEHYTVTATYLYQPRILCEYNVRYDCDICRAIILRFTYLTSPSLTCIRVRQSIHFIITRCVSTKKKIQVGEYVYFWGGGGGAPL
jgi:hypothetical protein